MAKEGGYASMKGDEALWRGEVAGELPVAVPGSEVLQVDYRLPNQRDPFEQVATATGPDQSMAEGALDVSRFEQAPARAPAEEEVQSLNIELDLSQLNAEKKAAHAAEVVSASIKEALTRFQNATTDEERQSAFADIKRARGDDDMRLAA